MEIQIDIESMHCKHCARNIERYLRDQPGVEEAEVDFDGGVGLVKADAEMDVDPLVEMIEAMGYGAAIREDG